MKSKNHINPKNHRPNNSAKVSIIFLFANFKEKFFVKWWRVAVD